MSQQAACEEYARKEGIDVAQIFIEQGESAKFADRTQLLELIDFCRTHKGEIEALLVWKVDRFARNVADHFNIKATLAKHGVRIVSVTEPIDANPEGKLMETILAGFAQFDNDVRAMRTVQGMRRKIQEGLFPWNPPLGYKSVTGSRDKKTRPDEPDEPNFGLLRRAWKEFATGAHTKADMVRIMKSWGVANRRGRNLSPQAVDHIFANPFYKGILIDPWTGDEHQGLHVPMVTAEEFVRVQKVIQRRNRKLKHQRHREEFPLRGLVRCPACRHYLTASISRGRSQCYPYYTCHKPDCVRRGKSIPAEQVVTEFTEHLARIAPEPNFAETLEATVLIRASERDAALVDKRTRDLQANERVRNELRELIEMKTRKLITLDEFTVHYDRLKKAEQNIAIIAPATLLTVEELRARISAIAAPLIALVETWMALAQSARVRFQQTIFPTGYVFGEVRTAELGLLFTLFGGSPDSVSHGVPLTYHGWNRLEDELALFLSIIQDEEVMNS